MKFCTGFLSRQHTLVLAVTFLIFGSHALRRRKDLYIGIFVSLNRGRPVKGWNSVSVLPGLEMALAEVNNNSEILRNYNLTAVWKDEKVTET